VKSKLAYRCPNCGDVFHGLTDKADLNIIATGEMFFLLPYYRDLGWESFEEAKHIEGGNLVCPECNYEYSKPESGLLYRESVIKA